MTDTAAADHWLPMADAPKDRTIVIAMIRPDLAEAYPAHAHLHRQAGLQMVVRHPGLGDDGFDVGWNLAGPFGYGGWLDDFFAGYKPLAQTAVDPAYHPRTSA